MRTPSQLIWARLGNTVYKIFDIAKSKSFLFSKHIDVLKLRFKKHRVEMDVNDPKDFIDELLIEQKKSRTEKLYTGENVKYPFHLL